MRRSTTLLRDYGLALALLLAAALLAWRTLLPAVRRNWELDREWAHLQRLGDEVDEENRRLLLLEQARSDPIVMERLYRMFYGDLDPLAGTPRPGPIPERP